MIFSISLLGVSGAVPAYGRFPTSQILRVGGHSYLIDCGEGTQMQMQRFGIGRSGLDHIFISHLHGDHIYGLPGLITSMALNGRTTPLYIHSPPGLAERFAGLQLNVDQQPFALHYVEHDPAQAVCIHTDARITVTTIPLRHRIPTAGFLFREPVRARNLLPGVIEKHHIPYAAIPSLKAGHAWHSPQGETIQNDLLTTAPPPPRSYAFCTDTLYLPSTADQVAGVDILYHEATFVEAHAEQARTTYHSTAREAARVAADAGVGKLLIGHFSARYPEVAPLEAEARSIFPESYAAIEGETHTIPFRTRGQLADI